MSKNLLKEVEKHLMPHVADLGGRICNYEASQTSFDNALVVLQAGDLRIRVVRERSQVFADFGSDAEPGSWFDSAVVMELMGLSQDAGFHSRDSTAVLTALGRFVKTFWTELQAEFAAQRFSRTKEQLVRVQESRADRRLGPVQ